MFKILKSNKLLTLLNSIFLLIFLYILFKYTKSTDFYSGFYLNFLIYLILFFIIFNFFQFKKLKNIKIFFNILLFSILMFLYSAEIFLNFFVKPINDLEYRKIQADKSGLTFDTRTKYQVLMDLKNSGEIVVPSVPPNDILHKTKKYFKGFQKLIYPIAGISNSKTVFCNESGKRIIYVSDKHGFRNKNEIWKDENKVDIVILGDSHVHGACVENEFLISNLLANLTKKSVLNLGFQGHGPLMQIAALREYALQKKPPIVLWYYFEANDLSNMMDEISNEVFDKYRNPNFSQNLIQNQDKIDNQLIKLIDLAVKKKQTYEKDKKKINITGISKLYKVRDLLSHILPPNKSLIRYRYYPIDPVKEYFTLLNYAKGMIENWGGELYFVYHPHPYRYVGSHNLYYGQRQYDIFLELLKKNKTKIIDLKKDLFDKVGDPMKLYHFGITGHPSENGYKLTAEFFVKTLSELD